MKGYKIANLANIIEIAGEDAAKTALSGFSCPLNRDVESFLRDKSIEFAKQCIAATHLVYASYRDELVLVGYFTLSNKIFTLNKPNKISKTLLKRCKKFMQYDQELNRYSCSAPLIAQLGKNFSNGYNQLISGSELLKIACDNVRVAQSYVGGKIAYLECEDKPKLRQFYENYGFVEFDRRILEKDERTIMDGSYLVQMLIYFS